MEMDKGINWNKFNTEVVPEKILHIINKLLSRDDRYKTPQEVIIDLSEYMYEVENIQENKENLVEDLEVIKNIDVVKKDYKFKKIAAVGVVAIISFLILGISM